MPVTADVPTPEIPGTNVLFDAWLVSRAANALLDDALVTSGLTADEFAVYSVLSHEPLTPTELAAWMSAPLTTVSSYVKRFEARGHVTRLPNADDRRSYRLTLTEDGAAAHQRAGERFLPGLQAVEAALGGDTAEVRRVLASLRAALESVRSSAEPGHH
jgi:DNA-binding MarR family transcriptional regulator